MEKRTNRSDRFDLGGTADSSNAGANMGGTMGSSIMKDGGEVDVYYQADYYDKQGGHGSLHGYSSNFETEYRKAMGLYTREKKAGELGKSTGYIGVSGSGKEFAILYLDKNYFDNMSENDFNTKSDYDVWMKVAKSVLETGKAKKGSYNIMKKGGNLIGISSKSFAIKLDGSKETWEKEVDYLYGKGYRFPEDDGTNKYLRNRFRLLKSISPEVKENKRTYLYAQPNGLLSYTFTEDSVLKVVNVFFADGGKMKTGGATKSDYSNIFKEVEDFGNQQYYIRKWGKVGTDKYNNIELLAVAKITDLENYMSEDELPKEGNFELTISLVPIEIYISKKHKESANDDSASIGSNTIVNIENYMGGLNYEPQNKVFFKTAEDAKKYLVSKELNDKISAEGMMSGFILDKRYNRAGQTNWDYLAYMTGESKKFANGGSLADLPENPNNDAISYKTGGKVEGGNQYDILTSRAYELADMLDGLNPASHKYKVLSQEMEEVRDRLDEIEEEDEMKQGGITKNEDLLKSFLTNNNEVKIGNLSTHYSTLGDVVLLRNYGTLIAKRRGKFVSISTKKYSSTTSKITNKVEALAKSMGLKVEKINEDQFKNGGVSDSDFEKDYKKVKQHIKDGYGKIDSDYIETTWENMSDITYSAIEDKLMRRLEKDELFNYAEGGTTKGFEYTIGGL